MPSQLCKEKLCASPALQDGAQEEAASNQPVLAPLEGF